MPDQYGFGDHAAEPAGPCQPNHDDNQMYQKDQELPHLGNRIKLHQTLDFARVLGIRQGQDQQLMLDQHRLRHHGTDAARPSKSSKSNEHMNEKHEKITHLGILSKPHTIMTSGSIL